MANIADNTEKKGSTKSSNFTDHVYSGHPQVSDEYLKRFPEGLRECLKNNEDSKISFQDEVYTDFEEITVYRAVTSPENIHSYDFLGNVEKRELDRSHCKKWQIEDFHWHSVSVNENKDELKKVTRFPNQHIQGIAKGIMKCHYGPADFVPGKAHHNWYLFDGANEEVCKDFSMDEPNSHLSGVTNGGDS